MRHETLYFACDGCEAPTGTVDNDIADDEIDTQMPPGWTQVIARRVMVNPDYMPAPTAEQIAQELASGIPPEERAAAMAGLMPMAQMQAQAAAASVEPQYLVDELLLHYCPTCSVSGVFDTAEALVAAEWISAPPAPVAPLQAVPDESGESDESDGGAE